MKESDFYSGDPLARLLIDGLKLTPIKFALLVLLLSFFYSLMLSFAASGPDYFFNNLISVLWVFVIAPIMAWFYLWGSREMPFLLANLRNSGAITLNDEYIDGIARIYKNPWRMIFSSIIALLLGSSVLLFPLHKGVFRRKYCIHYSHHRPFASFSSGILHGDYKVRRRESKFKGCERRSTLDDRRLTLIPYTTLCVFFVSATSWVSPAARRSSTFFRN